MKQWRKCEILMRSQTGKVHVEVSDGSRFSTYVFDDTCTGYLDQLHGIINEGREYLVQIQSLTHSLAQ